MPAFDLSTVADLWSLLIGGSVLTGAVGGARWWRSRRRGRRPAALAHRRALAQLRCVVAALLLTDRPCLSDRRQLVSAWTDALTGVLEADCEADEKPRLLVDEANRMVREALTPDRPVIRPVEPWRVERLQHLVDRYAAALDRTYGRDRGALPVRPPGRPRAPR